MRFKIVLLPALMLFVVSSYLWCLSFLLVDSSMKKTLVTTLLGFSIGGIVLAVGWFLLSLPSFYARLRKRGSARDIDFKKLISKRVVSKKREEGMNPNMMVSLMITAELCFVALVYVLIQMTF